MDLFVTIAYTSGRRHALESNDRQARAVCGAGPGPASAFNGWATVEPMQAQHFASCCWQCFKRLRDRGLVPEGVTRVELTESKRVGLPALAPLDSKDWADRQERQEREQAAREFEADRSQETV